MVLDELPKEPDFREIRRTRHGPKRDKASKKILRIADNDFAVILNERQCRRNCNSQVL